MKYALVRGPLWEWLVRQAPGYEWDAWPLLMTKGDTVDWHAHVTSHRPGVINSWAGVLFLTDGPGFGTLQVRAVRASGLMMSSFFAPRIGRVVLFPADSRHRVLEHESDAERWSLGFSGYVP